MLFYKRWVIYLASVFLIISAMMVPGSHLYYMAAMIIVLPIISRFIGMFALQDLSFSRETPGTCWEGETATFHIVAHSRARMYRLFLQAEDQSNEWLRPVEATPPLFNVAPHTETRIPYEVELLKRGAYTIEYMTVTALDPLGIYAFSRRYPIKSELLVYPVPQEIPELPLSGSERYGFRDLPVAVTRGSGVDPDGVREYVPGDPLRRMHWKSTARTGRLNVIEFEESRALNIVLAIDTQQGTNVGPGKETTLEALVKAAASLAQSGIRQGASVKLIAGDELGAAGLTGRGSDHLYVVLGGLARVEATDSDPLSARLVERVGTLLPGTTLVTLTSNLDTALPGAIAHYTLGGAQAVAVYADPRSFQPGSRIPTRGAQRAYVENLLAAGASVFILSHHEGNEIRLDSIRDAHIFHED